MPTRRWPQVMDGEATQAQLGGLLLALRMRGETVDELTGFAHGHARARACSFRTRRRHRHLRHGRRRLEDLQHLDRGGARGRRRRRAGRQARQPGDVVRNRVGGRPGGARNTDRPTPDQATEALATDGFAFLFAPSYHPAMRHAGPVRRELGVPTAFNLLGPITNPAGVRRQVIGVADPKAAAKVAHVLHQLGSERAFVVHGNGVDELPLDGSGVVYDVSTGGVRKRRIDSVGAWAGGRPEFRAARRRRAH